MTQGLFLSNLLLALVWVIATGTLTEENFIFGFLISFGILWIITIEQSNRKYFVIIPKLLSFVLFMVWEIIKSNFQTVVESLYSKSRLAPAIVAVPLTAKTDFEISTFANLLSLTPGTLVIDVADDKKVMYVHVMHLEDKQKFVDEVKNNFERRLLEILR